MMWRVHGLQVVLLGSTPLPTEQFLQGTIYEWEDKINSPTPLIETERMNDTGMTSPRRNFEVLALDLPVQLGYGRFL